MLYQDLKHKEIFGDDTPSPAELLKQQQLAAISSDRVLDIKTSTSTVSTNMKQLAEICATVLSKISQYPKSSTFDMSQFTAADVTEFLKNDPHQLTPSTIVPAALISHFLQADEYLQQTALLLTSSVDATNCVSLLSLADTLTLPGLFEAAMGKVTASLDTFESYEGFDVLPGELKRRVKVMRSVVGSSIIGRGQKSNVFFASAAEFLAIFSDSLVEQRDRLRDAKERQAAIVGEEEGSERREAVVDAAKKIERQTRRLETLQRFYVEQKEMFRVP